MWHEAQRLTNALKIAYPDLYVQIIQQRIGAATTEEQAKLNIIESNSWIREVYLCSGDKKIVYARVVVPNFTYKIFKADLDNLGTKFLGEDFLYKHADLQRSEFEYYQIKHYDEELYARRSIFTLQDCKFLVQEGFK